MSLGGGLPENPAFLAIGIDNKAPYPLSLGMGCSLYHSLNVGLLVASDKQGNAALPLSLPLIPALRDQRIYTQFFQIELTPKIGLRASNYGRILIGR
ncbi:MAG: hypothetical protein ACE5F1_10670 [Planctomycetota bacterium]